MMIRSATTAEVVWNYLAHKWEFGRGGPDHERFASAREALHLDAPRFPEMLAGRLDILQAVDDTARLLANIGPWELRSLDVGEVAEVWVTVPDKVWRSPADPEHERVQNALAKWSDYLRRFGAGEAAAHAQIVGEVGRGSFASRTAPIIHGRNPHTSGKPWANDGRHRLMAIYDASVRDGIAPKTLVLIERGLRLGCTS